MTDREYDYRLAELLAADPFLTTAEARVELGLIAEPRPVPTTPPANFRRTPTPPARVGVVRPASPATA